MNMKLPEVKNKDLKMNMKVLNAGNYRTMEKFIKKDNKMKQMWGPALFFLIEHPTKGYIMFDTGYDTRYYAATKKFPYSILKVLVPARVSPEENSLVQLHKMHISPDDVTVILSHLHIDHAAGIHDYPNSKIYISEVEWEYTRKSALKLLGDNYLKSLFDQINPDHVEQIDFVKGFEYGPFKQAVDIFGDESLIAVPLFGHTVGQIGLIVNCSETERYFLIADSVYTRENYEQMVKGFFLSNIAHTDKKRYLEHFQFLHDLSLENPDLQIMPAHDAGVYEQYVKSDS